MNNGFHEISREKMIHALSLVPIFSGIGQSEQRLLANRCVVMEYPADTVVIEQGEAGDKLYLIMKGSVLVSVKNSSGIWVQVAILHPGEVIGEIAILNKVPRTARVTTRTTCSFLSIYAQDFLQVYQYFPPRSRDNIQLVIKKRLEELKQYR